MNIKYIVGTLIIIAFAAFAISSMDGAITPYVSITQAIESGEPVQVKGERIGNGEFDIEENLFKFTLQDGDGQKINVVYDGAKPGNFDQAVEVVCKGEFKDGLFIASDILVKCPSKYQEIEAKV